MPSLLAIVGTVEVLGATLFAYALWRAGGWGFTLAELGPSLIVVGIGTGLGFITLGLAAVLGVAQELREDLLEVLLDAGDEEQEDSELPENRGRYLDSPPPADEA